LDRGALDGVAEGEPRAGDDVPAPLGLPAPAAEAAPAEHVLQDVLEAGPTAGGRIAHPRACAAAEHAAEEVLETARAAGTAGARGEAGAATGHGAHGVVLLALLGVGEDGVSLADALEPRLGGGVVGV